MTWLDADWTAISLSLKAATLVALTTLPFAIALGYFLARTRYFYLRALVETIIFLPLVMPPVATGYLLLIVFSRLSPVGEGLYYFFGIQVPFSFLGVVIASFVVSLPLAVRSVRVALESIDHHWEEVALTLGASKWMVLLKVTLPLAWPGILSASVLAFIRSMGEFGATIVLAGNIAGETRTLSIALWNFLQEPGKEEPALWLLAFSIVFGFILLLLSEFLTRRLRRYRLD